MNDMSNNADGFDRWSDPRVRRAGMLVLELEGHRHHGWACRVLVSMVRKSSDAARGVVRAKP